MLLTRARSSYDHRLTTYYLCQRTNWHKRDGQCADLGLLLIQATQPTMFHITTYSGTQQGWRLMGTRETPELALRLLTALERIKPTFKHRIECDVMDHVPGVTF